MAKAQPVMIIKGKVHLSVKEFARVTKRFPNHIYSLINVGNSQRKLRAVQAKVGHNMVWFIPETEVNEFPFTPDSAMSLKFRGQLELLEGRVEDLEQLIDTLECRI